MRKSKVEKLIDRKIEQSLEKGVYVRIDKGTKYWEQTLHHTLVIPYTTWGKDVPLQQAIDAIVEHLGIELVYKKERSTPSTVKAVKKRKKK